MIRSQWESGMHVFSDGCLFRLREIGHRHYGDMLWVRAGGSGHRLRWRGPWVVSVFLSILQKLISYHDTNVPHLLCLPQDQPPIVDYVLCLLWKSRSAFSFYLIASWLGMSSQRKRVALRLTETGHYCRCKLGCICLYWSKVFFYRQFYIINAKLTALDLCYWSLLLFYTNKHS